MALTPSQKVSAKLAAVIGAIQGIAWAVLSLICIIIYYRNSIPPSENSTSYSDLLNFGLRMAYLTRNSAVDPNRTIRPKDFIVLMWIYFFASIVWITISVDLFISVYYNKNRQSKLMVIWGTITISISIIDLVLFSLLLRDYLTCPTIDPDALMACSTITGIVMTLSARGFVLWLVNFIVAIVLIINGVKIATRDHLKGVVRDLTIPRARAPTTQANSVLYQPRYPPSSNGNQTPTTPNLPVTPNIPNSNEYPMFMRNDNYGY